MLELGAADLAARDRGRGLRLRRSATLGCVVRALLVAHGAVSSGGFSGAGVMMAVTWSSPSAVGTSWVPHCQQ